MLKKVLSVLGVLFLITSCTTSRIPNLSSRIAIDTLYINKEHYDSIYITRTSDSDRTRDTITITKTMTEYRFRLLRDTIYKTRIDSIPYEVRITDVKEVPRPRNLFDYISYVCFGILVGFTSMRLYGIFRTL